MQNVERFLANASSLVEAELDRRIPPEVSEPTRLHEAIRWSVFGGGKRFRPALVLALGRTFGVADEKLIATAAAVEMIHTYSLIHDDLPSMDDDDLRRGRATCHKKYGEATAILAGDALQSMAFETIAEDEHLSPEIRVKLISRLSDAAGKMVAGQQLDISAEGKDATSDEVSEIHKLKTGALITFSACAGAIIAGISEESSAGVELFGARLGLLFQLSDDILDITEPTAVLGKTAAKDASSKKATYPSIYGVERSKDLLKEAYDRALDALEPVGAPTELLANIAYFVMERRS